MSTYRQREQKTERPKLQTVLLSLAYIIFVGVAAFFLAGLVMAQVDLYEVLGLYGSEIPLIKVPGEDIPRWALQLALAALMFFLFQPLAVFALGLISRGKDEEEFDQEPAAPWKR